MRIVVFSDSHGNVRHCIEVIDHIKDIDMIIHLGDILRDVEDLKILYPYISIEYVVGNNDCTYGKPKEKLVQVAGKKIFITHGHCYGVKKEYASVVKKGISLKADGVLFGHTHQSYEAYHEGMVVLNPGSISLPLYGKPSYGMIEVENSRMRTCICNI